MDREKVVTNFFFRDDIFCEVANFPSVTFRRAHATFYATSQKVV